VTITLEKWLLLVHQVPPSPAYLRAKILRRLKQIGALALKKSAYLLPDTDDALEDFQWLLKEIRSDGGDAWILRSEMVAGLSDESLRQSFRDARAADYRELLEEARAAADEGVLRRLRKRFEEIARIDFFDAPGKEEVVNLMSRAAEPMVASLYRGRRWVTRKGIKIDRTACCWLIRRFIDPSAEIVFVDPAAYAHTEGELRFDMFEGEFTHEGDRCSFEVLIDRCGLASPAMEAIAEIVHDLDLKDSKFGRPETAGLAAMIDGLALRHADDAQRMEGGMVVFDALHARLAAVREG
jgi:hypothetical protein